MSDQLITAVSLGLQQVAIKEELEFVEAMYEDAGYVIGSIGDESLVEFFCGYSDYLNGLVVFENDVIEKEFVELAESIINDLIGESVAIFEKDESRSKRYKSAHDDTKANVRFLGSQVYGGTRLQRAGLRTQKGNIRASIARAPMRIGSALRRGIIKGLGKAGKKIANWRMARTKKAMKKAGKSMVKHTKKAAETSGRAADAMKKKGKLNKVKNYLSSLKSSYHVGVVAKKGRKAAKAKDVYQDWKKAKAGKPGFSKKMKTPPNVPKFKVHQGGKP